MKTNSSLTTILFVYHVKNMNVLILTVLLASIVLQIAASPYAALLIAFVGVMTSFWFDFKSKFDCMTRLSAFPTELLEQTNLKLIPFLRPPKELTFTERIRLPMLIFLTFSLPLTDFPYRWLTLGVSLFITIELMLATVQFALNDSIEVFKEAVKLKSLDSNQIKAVFASLEGQRKRRIQ
jgi:hypothetical protein